MVFVAQPFLAVRHTLIRSPDETSLIADCSARMPSTKQGKIRTARNGCATLQSFSYDFLPPQPPPLASRRQNPLHHLEAPRLLACLPTQDNSHSQEWLCHEISRCRPAGL